MTLLSTFNQRFTSITADSRRVQAGSLFLAYPGANSDGRDFIPQAIQVGAAAIAWEQAGFAWQDIWNQGARNQNASNQGVQLKNIAVNDLKHQVGYIAAEYYQYPTSQLTMIGVTGTNGKTSVSQWLAQCLTHLGEKTAVLGTLGNGVVSNDTANGKSCALAATSNTTPDALLLQAMLADYVQQQVEAVVMEVSSHGLDQGRVNGVVFDIAILTNLSRDHLDYHGTMDAYASAKQRLFAWEGLGSAIVNIDDAFGKTIANTLKVQGKSCLTYGFELADIRASALKLDDAGLRMQVSTPQGDVLLTAPVLGRFNAYNVLAVLATLLTLKVPLQDAVAVIAKIKPVLGRMQQFGGGELPLVVIDYAHTPDALEKVLLTLREQTQGKLMCVFGCGGDRDAGKRPMMGKIAAMLADQVVVTSDNPRSEDASAIIQAIISGMDAADCLTNYLVETDRAMAISNAIQSALKGDIVLVAGKGHENYQEILGIKHHFDDAEVAQSALNIRSSNKGGLEQCLPMAKQEAAL